MATPMPRPRCPAMPVWADTSVNVPLPLLRYRVLGKGAALIPSSKKRGGLGVVLDIPLGHKDAAFVRSHFDGMEVRLNDAPRANEIMVAIAVTDSGRPLARVGGLTKDQIQGEDGLR